MSQLKALRPCYGTDKNLFIEEDMNNNDQEESKQDETVYRSIDDISEKGS